MKFDEIVEKSCFFKSVDKGLHFIFIHSKSENELKVTSYQFGLSKATGAIIKINKHYIERNEWDKTMDYIRNYKKPHTEVLRIVIEYIFKFGPKIIR